ncbi:MAG TPA: alkaline phosphatase family protein, partial [Acidimicrobiales bacterium]
MAPEPMLPDYGGPCLTGVVPALLSQVRGASLRAGGGGGGSGGGGAALPAWVPEPVGAASQVVLLVLDGLGWRQLEARRGLAPVLASGVGGSIRSVVPSTTACCLSSLATGRPPGEHGIIGYRVAVEGEIMNVLQWSLGGRDARMRLPAAEFQSCPTFPGGAGNELPVPVVTRYDYGATGFTAAHLG